MCCAEACLLVCLAEKLMMSRCVVLLIKNRLWHGITLACKVDCGIIWSTGAMFPSLANVAASNTEDVAGSLGTHLTAGLNDEQVRYV